MERRQPSRWRPLRRRAAGGRQGLALGGVGTWSVVGLLAVAAIFANRWSQQELSGSAYVIDGDTLRIGAERVRLIGIDAPELDQTCRATGGGIACGKLAREHLRAIAESGQVRCSADGFDRYGRLLGRCSAGGIDLNATMVSDGWAVDYGGYAAEEHQARQAGRGIWAYDFDTPSDWRHANPRQSQVEDFVELDAPPARRVDGGEGLARHIETERERCA